MVTEDTRHLTASMIVLDLETERVLLIFHNATEKWMFPGGHVDEDEAPAEAAQREVLEETGVTAHFDQPWSMLPGAVALPTPFMVAEFPAPHKPQWKEPAHHHIDELFIGFADGNTPLAAQLEEVKAAAWVRISKIDDWNVREEVPMVLRSAWARVKGDH
jgi:8-oxo-dGTP pyrophosphatase MutT (NUDIX family)